MKLVSESTPAQRIRAIIVLSPKGKLVANIHALYPTDGMGRLQVDVFTYGSNAIDRQVGTASGYGYDKFTAALRGLKIDGITLHDHAEATAEAKRTLSQWQKETDQTKRDAIRDRAKKKGINFCNWSRDSNGWAGVYMSPALELLRDLGYQVIDAI